MPFFTFLPLLLLVTVGTLSPPSIQAAPLPQLSSADAQAQLLASQQNNFTDIWDVCLNMEPADQALLKQWFSDEVSEVLLSQSRNVIAELTNNGRVVLVQGEHLQVVVKRLSSQAEALNERFAYRLSEFLEQNLVPTTEIQPGRMGQLYVGDSAAVEELGVGNDEDIIFDRLANNSDRNPTNILITEDGNRVLIDNEDGLSSSSGSASSFESLQQADSQDYFDFFSTHDRWRRFRRLNDGDWDRFLSDNNISIDDARGRVFMREVTEIRNDMEELLEEMGEDRFFRIGNARRGMLRTSDRETYRFRAQRSGEQNPGAEAGEKYGDGC